MDQESYLNELDRIPFPTINYRQKINYGLSVVNFFALAMGLFMMSAPMMGWIGYESPSLGTAYMFGGFCEYIIGFYDWYAGRTMISFIDFILAFYISPFIIQLTSVNMKSMYQEIIILICKESFIVSGSLYSLLYSLVLMEEDAFISFIYFY
jgi:hypothetical protein